MLAVVREQRGTSVLLASHLINTPDANDRLALLAAIARHLGPDGQAFIEWHPPAWFDALEPFRTYTGTLGDLVSTMHVHSLADGLLTATVSYETQTGSQLPSQWTHDFTARCLALGDLDFTAARVGLNLVGPLPEASQWLRAQAPGQARPAAAG